MKQINNYRKCRIKVGDEVCVINGDNKDLKAKIIDFNRETGRIKLAGLLLKNKFLKDKIKKNSKTDKEVTGTKDHETIHISNVSLMENGVPVRVGRKNGKRVSVRSGNEI